MNSDHKPRTRLVRRSLLGL